ncbi:GspH/FimT family pseudopilin [Dokdonella sp.]|uniref:GspH/FimT family pseudopilin n=1 Tax=Dokdonella sp. TaxID=2291710 RepID=UPI0037845D5B
MSESSNRAAFRGRRSAAGFTLFELMIAVAIVAILAAMAFPSYRDFSQRMNVTNSTNQLVGALNTARSEAVKRGRQVAVIANGGDWSRGWQIVAGKATAAGTVTPPVSPGATSAACKAYMDLDGVTPLCPRFDGPLPDRYTLLAKGAGTGASDTQIVFGGSGALVPATVTNYDFSLCRPSQNADPTQSRRVHVAPSGIITTYRDTTSSPAGACS